jgi:trigger factor
VKSAVESMSPTRVKLTIEVPADELKPSMDAAYKRIASQVTIPGFRKGHVPPRVIDQRFGRGAVLEEAINEAVPRAYDQAVREAGIVALGRPEVDFTEITEGADLAFTAEVDVRPEFDLPDYDGIEVSVSDSAVTDDQVTEQLDALRKRFASLGPVERAAVDGDVLLVDLAGTDDGTPVDDLRANALSYELGTDGLLPGFDAAVAGVAPGESRTFAFTPDAGEWDGKDLQVTATITSVRERTLPDADDSFAQLASEFDTIGELRADISTRLAKVRLVEQGYEARDKVIEELLARAEVPVPEHYLAAQVEEHFADGHGDDAHRTEVTDQARDSLKSQFVLDRIAEAETLTVSEADLSQWLIQQAPRYNMTPDAFAQALAQNGDVPTAISDVRRGKAIAWVLEHAKVVDASGSPVELSQLEDLASSAGFGNDYDHDDHEGHDHEGQDHEGHDHAGQDHEGHDHAGQDHEGHDHAGHDHD